MAMLGLVSVSALLLGVSAATAAPPAEPPLVATPQGDCGPGSNPETDLQGRVPAVDHRSGRAAEGYSCNAELVGALPAGGAVGIDGLPSGTVGGYKVHRYVDGQGNECAYYDSSLLLGTDVLDLLDLDDLTGLLGSLDDVAKRVGVNVVDMSDPANPVLVDSMITPAMLSPHESLVLSQERGLIMATLGNPGFNVGVLDIYDISEDCRDPQLLTTGSLAGVLGHESGLAPDGMTFYSASPGSNTLFAVDISDPSLPIPVGFHPINSHGLSISADGDRAYVASLDGLDILDVSEIQSRSSDVIQPVSSLDWTSRSIPQNAIPITIGGHPYLVEIDEFGSGSAVGAGRIIDIADEDEPFVLSNLRLEVHQSEHFDTVADDVGNQSPIQGYAGHYCSVPTPVDPKIVACSMIMSGLRIFSIVDPANPVEIAYYNSPSVNVPLIGGNYAMSAPAFAPDRDEVWYSDGFTGFHAVRLTNGTFSGTPFVTPVQESEETTTSASPTTERAAPAATTPAAGSGSLPATGRGIPMEFVVVALVSGLAALVLARRGVRPTD